MQSPISMITPALAILRHEGPGYNGTRSVWLIPQCTIPHSERVQLLEFLRFTRRQHGRHDVVWSWAGSFLTIDTRAFYWRTMRCVESSTMLKGSARSRNRSVIQTTISLDRQSIDKSPQYVKGLVQENGILSPFSAPLYLIPFVRK